MNSDTGEIRRLTPERAKELGFNLPLGEIEARDLIKFKESLRVAEHVKNRHERRRLAKQT